MQEKGQATGKQNTETNIKTQAISQPPTPPLPPA
jgi:hypothetical protein